MDHPTNTTPANSPRHAAEETLADFTDNMQFRASQDPQYAIYEENRRRVIDLATYVFNTLPRVPERTIIKRRLEDALMRMNQIVAVHGVGLDDQAQGPS